MEADLPINDHIVIPGSELELSASRASGPGGQHVNKTSSRVSLRFRLAHTSALTEQEKNMVMLRLKSRLVGDGDLLIHEESQRSQFRNRQLVRERLAKIIAAALHRKKPRIATKATAGSKSRRIESKKRRGTIKKLRKFLGE